MKKKEIIVVLILVALLAAVLLFMNLSGDQSARRMIITVDGVEYKDIVLTGNTNMQFTVETPYGYNEVIITNGVVEVVDADCKSQVCVDTKPASKINDKIVCLPHRMIIEIVKDDGETD